MKNLKVIISLIIIEDLQDYLLLMCWLAKARRRVRVQEEKIKKLIVRFCRPLGKNANDERNSC